MIQSNDQLAAESDLFYCGVISDIPVRAIRI
jgi:hypothetical protein